MLGERIADLGLPADPVGDVVCVKEAVLPFDRFAGADSLLGPEMRSTGEVMGIAHDFPTAFAKAQAAAGAQLPDGGTVFITVTDGDKPAAAGVAMALHELGFELVATGGTAQAIKRMGIPVSRCARSARARRTCSTRSSAGRCGSSSTRPSAPAPASTAGRSARAAVARGIPCITTMTGAMAAARAIAAARRGDGARHLAAGAAARASSPAVPPGSPEQILRTLAFPRDAAGPGAEPDGGSGLRSAFRMHASEKACKRIGSFQAAST